mgnify:CR=1 FL=1
MQIKLYTKKRLHNANCILTPNKMHQQNKIKRSTYKAKNSSKINFETVYWFFIFSLMNGINYERLGIINEDVQKRLIA